MTITQLAYVALGGAVGAVGRFSLVSAVTVIAGHGFPYGTLVVNILGSFVLGVLIEIFGVAWSPGQDLRLFLGIGVLGAFTTFSAFSLDAVTLFTRGQASAALAYVFISVTVSIGALWIGMMGARLVTA